MLAIFACVAVVALVNRFTDVCVSEAVLTIAIGVLMVAAGYWYTRWNGPPIFSADGQGPSRLALFLLGMGTLSGPLQLVMSDSFPIPGVIPLANASLLVLSPIFAAMSMIGPILLGSVFWRRDATWL